MDKIVDFNITKKYTYIRFENKPDLLISTKVVLEYLNNFRDDKLVIQENIGEKLKVLYGDYYLKENIYRVIHEKYKNRSKPIKYSATLNIEFEFNLDDFDNNLTEWFEKSDDEKNKFILDSLDKEDIFNKIELKRLW